MLYLLCPLFPIWTPTFKNKYLLIFLLNFLFCPCPVARGIFTRDGTCPALPPSVEAQSLNQRTTLTSDPLPRLRSEAVPSPGKVSLPLPVAPSNSLVMSGRWCATELMTRAVVSGHSACISARGLTGAARINLTPRTKPHCVASGGALAGTSGSKAQGEHRGPEGNRALRVWLTWFQISALSLSS